MSVVCERACCAQLLKFWSKIMLECDPEQRKLDCTSPYGMEHFMGCWKTSGSREEREGLPVRLGLAAELPHTCNLLSM